MLPEHGAGRGGDHKLVVSNTGEGGPPRENKTLEAEAESSSAHNVTIGVSFGATRLLSLRHLQSGAEFGFEQHDGDLFAFTTPVNSAFQHGILADRIRGGARISVIFWGRVSAAGERLI